MISLEAVSEYHSPNVHFIVRDECAGWKGRRRDVPRLCAEQLERFARLIPAQFRSRLEQNAASVVAS